MVENVHSVPKKVWQKWTGKQKEIFNNLFDEFSRVGPECLLHPQTVAKGISGEEYSTIAWNAAWLAAHVYRNEFTSEVITVDESGAEISSRVVM